MPAWFHPFVFQLTSFAPGPLWLALAVAPHHRITRVAVDAFLLVAMCLYTINLMPGIGELLPIIAKPTLGGVGGVLATPSGIVGGWTHFVIGDLWVGRFIALDAQKRGFHRLAVAPVLLVTLFFGPLGLLTYLVGRALIRRRAALLLASET